MTRMGRHKKSARIPQKKDPEIGPNTSKYVQIAAKNTHVRFNCIRMNWRPFACERLNIFHLLDCQLFGTGLVGGRLQRGSRWLERPFFDARAFGARLNSIAQGEECSTEVQTASDEEAGSGWVPSIWWRESQ